MKLVRFEPWHANIYKPTAAERSYFDARALRNSTVAAISIIDGEAVLGIVGWLVVDDEARITMLLSDALKEHPFFIHRAALRGIATFESCGIRRLTATCATESGRRWLQRLGFVERNGLFVR